MNFVTTSKTHEVFKLFGNLESLVQLQIRIDPTIKMAAALGIKDSVFIHDNTVAPKSERVLPLFSNKGKTAIVSGSGAGIGLAVAHALAESGADVAIWYNSNKDALTRAKEIEDEYSVKCELLESPIVLCLAII